MALIHRRSFLAGLFSAFAAPAIVRAESLMPVRTVLFTPPAIAIARHSIRKPTCMVCHGSWGMCSHTGGPVDLTDMRLDPRIVENIQIDLMDS